MAHRVASFRTRSAFVRPPNSLRCSSVASARYAARSVALRLGQRLDRSASVTPILDGSNISSCSGGVSATLWAGFGLRADFLEDLSADFLEGLSEDFLEDFAMVAAG